MIVALSEFSLEMEDVVLGIVTARGIPEVCLGLRSNGLKEGDRSGGGMTLISFDHVDVVSFSRILSKVEVLLSSDDRSSLMLLELRVGIRLSVDLIGCRGVSS